MYGRRGGRTGPQVVIQIFWRSGVRRVVGGPHVVVAADFDKGDFTEFSFANKPVPGLDQVGGASPLGTDLDDPTVFTGGFEQGLALHDINADRLLKVKVSSSLDGGDAVQGMPMVRSSDQHDVEVLFLQHLAIVMKQARLLVGGLAGGHDLGCPLEHATVHIAEGNHFDR